MTEVLWNAGCVLAGFAAGCLGAAVLNRIPAGWLCDYGEKPGAELFGKRVSLKREGLVLGFVLALSFVLFRLQYGTASPVFPLACLEAVPLVLAALADAKYGILPDQFLLLLLPPAAANLGFDLAGGGSFYGGAASPFLGAACGAALFLALGLAGKLASGGEAIGFGDVKLTAALGFFCGFPQVFGVFILAILFAGIHFTILILRKKIGRGSYRPLGPYLCAAFLFSAAFRGGIDAAAARYWSLLGGGL